ncbi:putative membrane protein [Bacillus tianshenii]|uniref:Membrane protein n=1 Tax=Sutcliffiella tianshenii TaxID=1463404 RepID=A0ABS2P0R1_9BACI|nr:putative membrane protein [Bacillus tianshenii]
MATALLLPLFFLVRMKFTSKGKWIIPLISFLISTLGIFVLKTLTIWHSIIFMILLLLLTALLLQRQRLFLANTSIKEETTRTARDNKQNTTFLDSDAYEQKDIHRRKLVLEELSDQITEKK